MQIQGGTFGKSKEKGNGLTFGLKQKEKKEGEKKTKEEERKFTLTNEIKKSREIRMLSSKTTGSICPEKHDCIHSKNIY